jgi:hypothetical protein
MSDAATAAVTTYKAQIDVTNPTALTGFSFPLFTVTNLSSPGIEITGFSLQNGPPWDWINSNTAPGDPYRMVLPAGGTRTLLSGQESPNLDQNNGGPTLISYAFTGFDPGEFFSMAADPEASNGTSAVIDVRPFLLQQSGLQILAGVGFSNAVNLSSPGWTLNYFNPGGDLQSDTNQFYRLTLEHSIGSAGVPEPAAWALMILGFGGVGASLRAARRRIPSPTA